MRKRTIYHYIITSLLVFFISLTSCKKDEPVDVTDQQVYELAKSTSGFIWYGNSPALLAKSAGSGHPQPFLRTKYNGAAITKLGMDGKVVAGAIFPEGSLIVKELYENATTLSAYAIMYKQSTFKDADKNGWVWEYVDVKGNVLEPAAKKGVSCSSCHSESGNIDFSLMNKYFP